MSGGTFTPKSRASSADDACTIAAWHLNEAVRLTGAADAAQVISDAELLLIWMWRQPPEEGRDLPGPFEPRRISRCGPARVRDKRRRDAALTLLIDANHLFVHAPDSRVYLNPKSKRALQ